MEQTANQGKKTVRVIPAKVDIAHEAKAAQRKLRVAAYCRVSTKMEEQLNSYKTQKTYYTEKIGREPEWTLVDIYADKGLSGTSTKNRDQFNRMISACRRGRIDMIITKSISRFARNTVDCLKYVRMLRDLNVDVFFEEQGIHSSQQGAEFYITIFGSIAQSESENISANVRWGKAQRAKEGNVPFQYKRFLGYRRGSDGRPEIDPEQAKTVRFIFERFLAGDSLSTIAATLNEAGVPTATGSGRWQSGTISSILLNEKYKGDAVLNKTYTVDCISKQVRVNRGERPQYYVENNHPAIIDAGTFARAQEEYARRTGKRRVKQVGTKTEQGKYSGKYALTELLVCGECGKPYRRCTWQQHGQKRIVWRCINRLDYGKRYCRSSPTMDEDSLKEAVMRAVLEAAHKNNELIQTLMLHIGMGLHEGAEPDDDMSIQIRLAEIDTEFKKVLAEIACSSPSESYDDTKLRELMDEKHRLEETLSSKETAKQHRSSTESRLEEISGIMETLAYHPMEYDDEIVRRLLDKVTVISRGKILVRFVGGLEVEQQVY